MEQKLMEMVQLWEEFVGGVVPQGYSGGRECSYLPLPPPLPGSTPRVSLPILFCASSVRL